MNISIVSTTQLSPGCILSHSLQISPIFSLYAFMIFLRTPDGGVPSMKSPDINSVRGYWFTSPK